MPKSDLTQLAEAILIALRSDLTMTWEQRVAVVRAVLVAHLESNRPTGQEE